MPVGVFLPEIIYINEALPDPLEEDAIETKLQRCNAPICNGSVESGTRHDGSLAAAWGGILHTEGERGWGCSCSGGGVASTSIEFAG